jgi:glycosyltransferase involved in cell wall biosynthesis
MLEKSVITTLHTLLVNPEPMARSVLEAILRLSDYVSVPARVGIDILEKYYGTPADKIRYIPHGCPDVPFIRSEVCKRPLGLEDRIVLSTFGLLSRGKGVEYAIRALPPLIDDYPRILYLVIGVTHPGVRRYEGEAYRKELIDLVYSLGLERNVGFVNHFLEENELIRYLQATDVYLIPYPNEEQISSGTLTYALGAGKAIITTPFLHAREVLSQECAVRCDFKNPASITRGIKKLIKNPRMRIALEKRAYDYSRGMTWPNVAAKYIYLFHEALKSSPRKRLISNRARVYAR